MNELPPRPANAVFGMRYSGRTSCIGFSSVAEAEHAAHGLCAQGHEVHIFDKVTGEVVKVLAS